MKTERKEGLNFLPLLFCVVYFTSYITRNNYAAVLAEVISDLAITKELASIAVTGAFVCYGIGQPVVGWLGDRVPPKYLITIGLTGTAVFNLLASFQSNPLVIAVLWCGNGFCQSMVWPPLVRIVAECMSGEGYRRTLVNVVTAANVGTMVLYLTAPLVINASGWRMMLRGPAVFALLLVAVWQFTVKVGTTSKAAAVAETAEEELKEEKLSISSWQLVLLSGLPLILVGVSMMGLLKDGITTWMPTYINENFSLGTGVSILSAVVIPVFSVLCIRFSARVYAWCKNNELLAAGVFFAVATGGCVCLYLCFGNVLISVFLMALVTGCAHGVNQMLISNMPGRYKPYGRVSTMAGIINGFTYVGSALSAYGFAALAERWGWKPLVLVWALCACLGGAFCIVNLKRWKKFIA